MYNHWKWEEEAIRSERLAESISEYKPRRSRSQGAMGMRSRSGRGGSPSRGVSGAGSLVQGGLDMSSFGASSYNSGAAAAAAAAAGAGPGYGGGVGMMGMVPVGAAAWGAPMVPFAAPPGYPGMVPGGYAPGASAGYLPTASASSLGAGMGALGPAPAFPGQAMGYPGSAMGQR